MVVNSNRIDVDDLDFAYLALFLGQRANELVVTRLKKSGFRNARESHGYVIQHLIESERSITEIARRMGVSQQAASKAVAELLRLGVLETETAKDRRAKMVRLSKRGWASVKAARTLRAEIDKKLAARLGKRKFERTRTNLIACIRELGGVKRIASRSVREPR